MFFYRIPEPNQALVISGAKGGADGAQFRIVTGHGTFVAPWRSRARILSLDLYEAELEESCVTGQGIPLTVQAVAVFKVADDFQSIANAARRFLDQQDQMESLVGQILAGHLRSIVGSLTVEKIITDRNSLAQEVKSASSDEMEKLGLVVDAFQIQEVGDPSGYIKNLAAPHIAEVEKNARIAQAQADQAATEREQEANAQKAGFTRDSEIKQAGARAEVQAAQAEADQAGPLSQAKAAQRVTEEQAALAAKQAAKREAELVAEVQKPADAEAYKTVKLAQAQRDAMRAQADALGRGQSGADRGVEDGRDDAHHRGVARRGPQWLQSECRQWCRGRRPGRDGTSGIGTVYLRRSFVRSSWICPPRVLRRGHPVGEQGASPCA